MIFAVGGALFACFSSVEIDTEGNDEIYIPESSVTLSASSDSWNSALCSKWKWETSSEGDQKSHLSGEMLTVGVTEETESFSAEATCINIFGKTIGTSDSVSVNIGSYKSNVETAVVAADIAKCPDYHISSLPDQYSSPIVNEMTLAPTSTLMTSVQLNDVLYSTECDGLLVRVLTIPDPVSGMVEISSNISLQDVIHSFSTPALEVTLYPITISAADNNAVITTYSLDNTTMSNNPLRRMALSESRQLAEYNIIDQ